MRRPRPAGRAWPWWRCSAADGDRAEALAAADGWRFVARRAGDGYAVLDRVTGERRAGLARLEEALPSPG